MKYVSTRGGGKPRSFTEILLAGMAPDGGLYVPDSWPVLDNALLSHMQGMSYTQTAMHVMEPFVGDSIAREDLAALLEDTYEGGAFDHTAVAPMRQVGPNAWLLELFHGPTFSFKDYAMQFLGRLFDHVLEKEKKRITIVGATSGDTGSAAIEACKGCKNIDIFILHPHNRTSDVQRRQMTSVDAPNVHNIALEGTFDDCQALVKAMFADEKMRNELNLSAVNSINWARIMAQIVYYVYAALALGAPQRSVSFTVPTGNFGNVFACWAAGQMGVPIERRVIATNRNDILTRFFESGTMRVDDVVPSLSPSMDIQVSSNFERYLFELHGRDAKALTALMQEFKKKGSYSVDKKLMDRAKQEFKAMRCHDNQTMEMIGQCYKETGIFIDPHTAVGMYAATSVMSSDPTVPMIVLGCAHPAKFPDAVSGATEMDAPVPEKLAAVMDKAEHYNVIANDLDKVSKFIYQSVRQ